MEPPWLGSAPASSTPDGSSLAGRAASPYIADGRYLYPTALGAEELVIGAAEEAATEEIEEMVWPKPTSSPLPAPARRELPETVIIDPNVAPRFTADELELLEEDPGKTLEELMGEGSKSSLKMRTIAWLKLRRMGFTDVTWQEAGAVILDFEVPPVDPTGAAISTPSQVFADIGE